MKKGNNMLIKPINNSNNNINLKSQIKPTPELQQGFNKIENCINSGTMKNFDYAKDFLDSIVRIRDSKKHSSFKIEIDKRREDYSYIKINGRRTNGGHNERQANIQDDYLIVEGVKKYASKLEDIEPSYLDILKAKIEEAEAVLDELHERYARYLQIELKQAQKDIFDATK